MFCTIKSNQNPAYLQEAGFFSSSSSSSLIVYPCGKWGKLNLNTKQAICHSKKIKPGNKRGIHSA